MNNHYPHDIETYFQYPVTTYSTRQAYQGNFRIPLTRLRITQHNFQYAITKHWNSLPPSLKCINSRKSFKEELRNHIVSKT